jgi:hypothetical protein
MERASCISGSSAAMGLDKSLRGSGKGFGEKRPVKVVS